MSIIFYDIPSREPIQGWSPHTWKVRMTLNLKKIPYEVKWVEYPDIKSLGEQLNLPPNPDFPAYTLPTISLPGPLDRSNPQHPRAITDSLEIVKYLESQYPHPPLHLDSPVLPKLREILGKLWPGLRGLVIPRIPDRVLSLRSAEYFHETRSRNFGMPLAAYEKDQVEKGAWDYLKSGAKEMGELLREGDGGPFFMGKELSYADIIVAAALEWVNRGNEEAFNVFMESAGEGMKELWEATAPWRERSGS